MAQTPARDFIRDAEVDFRFYGGDLRNYANNTNTLTSTGAPTEATFGTVHGVTAFTGSADPADQTWMTSAQTAMTFEALISADMLHLGTTGSADVTDDLLAGDWKIELVQTPGAGETSTISLAVCFNADGFGGTYYITQDLTDAVAQSLLKGAPLHLVVSAQYTSGTTTLDVTTMANGVVTTNSTSDANHAMVAAPTNTIFEQVVDSRPVYFLRMWDSYQSDADVLADLYQAARRVLPGIVFPTVIPGTLTFNGGG